MQVAEGILQQPRYLEDLTKASWSTWDLLVNEVYRPCLLFGLLILPGQGKGWRSTAQEDHVHHGPKNHKAWWQTFMQTKELGNTWETLKETRLDNHEKMLLYIKLPCHHPLIWSYLGGSAHLQGPTKWHTILSYPGELSSYADQKCHPHWS